MLNITCLPVLLNKHSHFTLFMGGRVAVEICCTKILFLCWLKPQPCTIGCKSHTPLAPVALCITCLTGAHNSMFTARQVNMYLLAQHKSVALYSLPSSFCLRETSCSKQSCSSAASADKSAEAATDIASSVESLTAHEFHLRSVIHPRSHLHATHMLFVDVHASFVAMPALVCSLSRWCRPRHRSA